MKFAKLATISIAFVSAVLMIGFAPTGVVLASKQPLHPGETIDVSGILEYVDWIHSDPSTWYFDENGNYVMPGDVMTWKPHGDIEGVYVDVIDTIIPYPWNTGTYYIKGKATFTGEVLGKKTSWTANIEGSGYMPDYSVFEGQEAWNSTIINATRSLSHMRGVIRIEGEFGPNVVDPYTYSGTLYFEQHKNEDK